MNKLIDRIIDFIESPFMKKNLKNITYVVMGAVALGVIFVLLPKDFFVKDGSGGVAFQKENKKDTAPKLIIKSISPKASQERIEKYVIQTVHEARRTQQYGEVKDYLYFWCSSTNIPPTQIYFNQLLYYTINQDPGYLHIQTNHEKRELYALCYKKNEGIELDYRLQSKDNFLNIYDEDIQEFRTEYNFNSQERKRKERELRRDYNKAERQAQQEKKKISKGNTKNNKKGAVHE